MNGDGYDNLTLCFRLCKCDKRQEGKPSYGSLPGNLLLSSLIHPHSDHIMVSRFKGVWYCKKPYSSFTYPDLRLRILIVDRVVEGTHNPA